MGLMKVIAGGPFSTSFVSKSFAIIMWDRPMQKVQYPARALVGLGLVALLSLYAIFSFDSQQIERNKIQKDAFQVAADEERFEALKKDLPPGAMVGYVSDLGKEAGILLAAQYALVPALLVARPPSGLFVGNFSRPMDYVEFGRANGMLLLKDYGYGVTLFRKTGP